MPQSRQSKNPVNPVKTSALSLLIPETNPDKIGAVLLAYGQMEGIHQRLKLLYQAAQGACLFALREAHGHPKGGGVTSARCGGASWETFIESKFGFSVDKATRRINQWKAMVPLFDKLPPADRERVADFLRRPMLHLTPVEQKALEKVTHKIATLQDEIAEAEACKFLKRPHGHGLLGNHDKSKKDADPVKAAPEQLFFDNIWLPMVGGGDGTVKTIWAQFDDVFEAWSKPTKVGNSTVPAWQHGERKQLETLLATTQLQKEVINKKLDVQIAQMKEALGVPSAKSSQSR